jgi:hypothetical protein
MLEFIFQDPPMPKTLIIGDIHGCFYELQALLDKAGLADEDGILGIGDIVDRGPETPQVLEFFQKTASARALMGNHERKHVRAARHEVQLSHSQRITQAQLGPTYRDALAWMGTLPLYLELPDAIVVHGYFEPGINLEHQNPSVLCGTMGGEKILRQRYDRPWYELYEASKPIIVGHENYTHTDQPFIYRERVYGLDTDCVTGKCLTGILLPSFQIISVPSRGNLWKQIHRSYKAANPMPARPRVSVNWSEEQYHTFEEMFHKLKEINQRLMLQVQDIPGFADFTPRQQAMVYSGLAGQGITANLLQLARLGKLDLELMRKIVRNPGQLTHLTGEIAAFANR